MKSSGLLEVNWILAELRPESFHARAGEHGVDLLVERDAERRLTPASAAEVVKSLRSLAGKKSWLSRVKMVCAIESRGLILRPFSLPAAAPAEVPRLLQLQLEGDFPLPPESLAWGWIPWPASSETSGKAGADSSSAEPVGVPAPVGSPSSQGPLRRAAAANRPEVLVAAVRKEVVEELAALFKPVSTELIFTPAILARQALISGDGPGFALLDVGGTQAEIILGEAGSAPTIRVLPWSAAGLTDSADAADSATLDKALERLLTLVPAAARKLPLWIAGRPDLAPRLARLLAGHWNAEGVPQAFVIPDGSGQTTAIAGLAQLLFGNGRSPKALPGAGLSLPGRLLDLRSKPAVISDQAARQFPVRPLAVTAALLAVVLFLPYLEAFLFQPRLARRLAELKLSNTQLATIDREFSFLRYLEQNQAPHLDAAFVIAQAAPQGARVQSVSMNRQGEVSLTGWLRDLAQVGDFRLKLVNSGFFSTVVVEDQSPTPDRQRINFRINARWKDAAEREALELGPVLTNSPAKPTASNLVATPSIPVRPIPPAP